MIKIQELIQESESLPIEERALVVDSLLFTLNRSDPKIDQKRAAVARKRLDEFRTRA